MLSLTVLTITVGFLGIVWWLMKGEEDKKGKKIPGPFGIPILGNVLQLERKAPFKTFDKWSEKYGDIYKVYFGSKLAIMVSEPKMIKEILSEPSFTGRQLFEGLEMYPGEPLGIVLAEGELWETHRRFLIRQLRDFGFGKSSMEQMIALEANETVTRLSMIQKRDGRVTDIKQELLIAALNSIFTILASKRYDHDDPEMRSMLENAEKITKEINDRIIYFLVPWTRRILPDFKEYKALRPKYVKFFASLVDNHKDDFQEDNLRDFVDVYLKEMKAHQDNPESTFYGSKAERQLHNILRDMHSAGSDTTTSSLTWAILYLSRDQKCQEKLQKEIEKVTSGNSRQASLADRPSMPYTMALIDEVLRKSSILPQGVQHRAMEGKYFQGYWIPKDAWIMPNLHFVHHNPKIWGDPENFRPERFLSPDGLKYVKNDNLMAFQVGRRQCLGETVARNQIFLFLTNIFQKFSIKFDPEKPPPSFEPAPNFVLAPEPFSVILEERI